MSPDSTIEKASHSSPVKMDSDRQSDLTPRERNIIEAIGDKTLQAKDLAKAAGYQCNSNFRGTLSSLVKREHLQKSPDGDGYLRG
jgi:hypothetical protein